MAQVPKRINPQTNLEFWNDPERKVKKHIDWPSYNLHQVAEKTMFLDMLQDLCKFIDNKPIRRGRPYQNLQDLLFCMGLMAYNNKSSRRHSAELEMCKRQGLIEKVPHFNTIIKYFNEPKIKSYLTHLITISSLPLQNIEQDITVDSSGFSCSIFDRWVHHKYGKQKGKRLWRKAHVMSGVRTHIITAVIVDKGTSSDMPTLQPLLAQTKKNFKNVREVSADMAYSSRKNLQAISEAGAIGFIPFKKNSTKRPARCKIWKQMYYYFINHYDEFMTHYNKRSNAESVFSMIKRKFSNNLKNKTELAQDIEILLRILCHNICVLIRETFELGITTDFEQIIKHTKVAH